MLLKVRRQRLGAIFIHGSRGKAKNVLGERKNTLFYQWKNGTMVKTILLAVA